MHRMDIGATETRTTSTLLLGRWTRNGPRKREGSVFGIYPIDIEGDSLIRMIDFEANASDDDNGTPHNFIIAAESENAQVLH